MRKQLLAALAALTFAVPIAAHAQAPQYADGQPSYASGEENIHGRIVSFDGGYNLQVRDEQGYVDSVQLHQGRSSTRPASRCSPG